MFIVPCRNEMHDNGLVGKLDSVERSIFCCITWHRLRKISTLITFFNVCSLNFLYPFEIFLASSFHRCEKLVSMFMHSLGRGSQKVEETDTYRASLPYVALLGSQIYAGLSP